MSASVNKILSAGKELRALFSAGERRKKAGGINMNSSGGPAWLIVFLGNPGAKYEGTRHNAGFMAAEALARDKGVKISRLRFHALTEQCTVGGERVLLLKPQTYMNLSGGAVQEAMRFYRVPLDHVLVISDDVSLPVGRLRVRRSGSAGGHNGLKDIIAKCGGEGFPRVKIGVGAPPNPEYALVDWVLSRFTDADQTSMHDAARRCVMAIETVIKDGIDVAMNRFN